MIRNAVIALAAGILPALPVAAAAETSPVEWTISPSSGEGGNMVQLMLSQQFPRGGRSTHSGPRPLGELQGLSAAQLASGGGPAAFRIVREAGTLDCAGVAGGGRGAGKCSFRGNDAFAAALERRGIGRPTEQQQYQLALQDVRLGLVTELERQGYRPITVNKLVAAGIHRVTVPYLRSLSDAGYRLQDMDKLVSFRIHRVDADYIREVEQLNGTARFSPEELVAMRIHRVSGQEARQLAELGYDRLSHSELMSMAIHRVTPDYIRELGQAGYRNLSPKQLVAMRIHRVTPEFAREMRRLAQGRPSPDDLVRMRIHGVPERRRR